MTKEIKEMGVSGDVAGYAKPLGKTVKRKDDINNVINPLKHDCMYRNCPCFYISKSEFRNLIKNNIVPEKIITYSKLSGLDDLYMKNKETKITVSFKKIKKLMGLKQL